MPVSTDTSRPRPRHATGLRGSGNKPARTRSIDEFSKGFAEVSSKRSRRRLAARDRRADKRDEDIASGLMAEKRTEIEAAFEACLPGGTPTQKQRDLVNQAENARFFGQRARSAPDAQERIRDGYRYGGGFVADKYLQKPFVERGFRSWWHPFFQRFVASCARARTGRLMAGMAKGDCVTQWSKIDAMDQPYSFFCEAARDMFRIDIDRTFESEAHLQSWIDHIVQEHDLPCAPHVASWIPDDRAPGKIINPHLWILLPENHHVWNDKSNHRLLNAVAAALTKLFGGDPGGLAFMFHGKNPVSPHCGVAIIQDQRMPMLEEWKEAFDLTWDPEMMARKLMLGCLGDADFDPEQSNTYFSFVARACRQAAKAIYKSGVDTADPIEFARKIAETAAIASSEEIAPTTHKARQAVDKLVETCSRWAAKHFDPAKMDKTGRDRGAAAHLMQESDSLKTRRQKGQAYGAGVKIVESRDAICAAIISEIKAGRQPTIRSITATGVRSLNTVKKHFFSAYTQAVASQSIQAIVKGGHTLPASSLKPCLSVLMTSHRPTELPTAWRTAELNEHFRQQQLRASRQRRRKRWNQPSAEAFRVPGRNLLDFIGDGHVTLHRRSPCGNAVQTIN